ncbi:MAG TPA: tetratricopeptide repeat protein [Candidatus Eisenbacteria bacterium]
MQRLIARRSLAAVAVVALFAAALARPADAGVNFTSGKVYVQQKVWDKACHFLELARQEEPDNLQVYSLLAFARAQMNQYASSGAAFAIGLKMAEAKKDDKRAKELTVNRNAVAYQLFNKGVGALNRAGREIAQDESRTTDDGTPQAAVEKERGAPKDFARFTENGQVQEFWYYPDAGVGYYFGPGATAPEKFDYKPYAGAPDPEQAITDTTVYGEYQGGSKVAEAAYDFTLTSFVDSKSSTSADTYKNLSYVFEVLGRADDAMTAARLGLAIKPGDPMLSRNMRVAAMGRGNRLFNAGQYVESVPAYRKAWEADPDSKMLYLSQIADAYFRAGDRMDKEKEGPARTAVLDSAITAFRYLYDQAPPDSGTMRENALYNIAVIYSNREDYKNAAATLDVAVGAFPNNFELLSLAGQTKYQANDWTGALEMLKRALAENPKDETVHQFLFLTYNKLGKKDESVGEYSLYKALNGGKLKTGATLKTWIDAAGNRLGANNQLKATMQKEGGAYPDEVRTYTDENGKQIETWFYWTKGKAVTFLDGQLLSQTTFPPAKS